MKINSYRRYKGLIVPQAIPDFLIGRIWVKEHTPFSQQIIDKLIQNNVIQTISGVADNLILQCNRCHNTNRSFFATFQCAKCQKTCIYCRHCIRMGRIASCTTLITWAGTTYKPRYKRNRLFHWQGTLTDQQQKAGKELIQSLQQNRSHLLHAVCGSGKTEILFQAVHFALGEGKRVCVATPRTDVVLELAPRFQQVFPQTLMHVLYGDAPKQDGHAQLVIATTHQLYRFQDAFDVVFVDEADAFPYSYDETLQRAVRKAKKAEAPILFITATPSSKLIMQCKKEKWGYSFIAKRYHGYPLPVPKMQSLWGYKKSIDKGKIPIKLRQWTECRITKGEPFLIFFPTIDMLEKMLPLFQEIHSEIQAVHAEDVARKEKVLALREELVPGLLTTTILERGVTFKNVQVAVVGAETSIFNASALIQISGRVGRNHGYPNGEIIFFHHGITTEMDLAIAEIQRMNHLGFPQQKGGSIE